MIPTRKLYLVRHAEVEPAYQRVFGGRVDMDLSDTGREQARILARYVSALRIPQVFASPMKRVQLTLEPWKSEHPQARVLTVPDLMEVDFGAWTGLNFEQVRQQFGARAFDWLDYLQDNNIPQAEPYPDFSSRMERCLKSLLHDSNEPVAAVFCHGGVIRMLLALLLDLPLRKMRGFDIEYASLTEVDYAPGRVEVQRLNFVPWRDLL